MFLRHYVDELWALRRSLFGTFVFVVDQGSPRRTKMNRPCHDSTFFVHFVCDTFNFQLSLCSQDLFAPRSFLLNASLVGQQSYWLTQTWLLFHRAVQWTSSTFIITTAQIQIKLHQRCCICTILQTACCRWSTCLEVQA